MVKGLISLILLVCGMGALGTEATAGMGSDISELPGIPIKFHLDNESYVTLVIEDSKGNRVRNLLAETLFPAGDNIAYWDGADDLGAMNFGPHGNYEIKNTIVEPGEYKARGLARGKVDLIYEFTIYNPVNPPWRTPDRKGQWLSDHTPPRCVLSLPGPEPQLLIGSAIAEGAHGLVWVDREGNKITGRGCIVGFAGAEALARDPADPENSVYAAAAWDGKLMIARLDKEGKSSPILERGLGPAPSTPQQTESFQGGRRRGFVQGLAARAGLLVASMVDPDSLLIVDVERRAALDELKVERPRGVSFLPEGALLVLSGGKLLRYAPFGKKDYTRPGAPSVLIEGLDEPQGLVVAQHGDIYISLRGKSHHVKVFDSKGALLRSIGKPGVPKSGPYDPSRMNNPNGLAVADDGRLWIAEEDFQPKRVSVWTTKGDFVKAFYGPTEYGGGGKLDPVDKRRFYYQGMEFAIDWEKGMSGLRSVFFRPEEQSLALPGGKPETPIHIGGRQYMTNVYNSNPVGGPTVAGVWLMRDGVAVPVAAIGQANDWEVLKRPELLATVPKELDIGKPASKGPEQHRCPVLFAWSDINSNGEIEADELCFAPGEAGGMNVTPDLSFLTAQTCVMRPIRFTSDGVPVYDVAKAERLLPDARICRGSGGDQVVLGKDGSFALTFPPSSHKGGYAMAGLTSAGKRWHYPSKWHTLHASQLAPAGRVPDPGELIGTTRVLGLPISIENSDAGELWSINANSGVMYLFTMDGLFVTTLFTNGWIGNHGGPTATRGMNINDMDSGGEGFWPTITKTADGHVYLQAINHTSSIVRVDGLGSAKRLPEKSVTVTADMLRRCVDATAAREAAEISIKGRKRLVAPIMSVPPVVDGRLDEWSLNQWAMIEPRTWASIAASGDRLYLAFRSSRRNLMDNAGGSPWQALFKSGGGLDLMLSPGKPSEKESAPKAGDLRLLTARSGGGISRYCISRSPMAGRVQPPSARHRRLSSSSRSST